MQDKDKTKKELIDELAKLRGQNMELETFKRKLRQSEETINLAYLELNQIFQAAGDSMRVIDKDFNVLRMNNAFCKLSGFTMDEGLGKKCYEVFHGPMCYRPDCPLSQILDGKERIECDVEKEHRDGHKVQCILTATPWRNSNGQLVGIVEDFKDVSKRKEAEKALLKYQNDLELLVERRVRELQEVNRKLENEIKERKMKEMALKNSKKELQLLSSRLLSAQEDERKFIAYNLHDGLGQILTSIIYFVDNIIITNGYPTPAHPLPTPEKINEQFASIISMVRDALREVRQISEDLRPPILDDLGIATTITWFCRKFEENNPWIFVTTEVDVRVNSPYLVELAIFRVLQEAMNNVSKHSQCRDVRVRLSKADNLIKLVVEDNGVGFDMPEASSVNENYRRGFGLLSMKERTILLGGSFSIQSTLGSGTVMSASWPCKQA